MQTNLKVAEEKERRKCPYLDTVNRKVLDFDLEKECSICLSHQNVYMCLVCGLYLQGRGEQTNAYTHSLQNGHHVFLNVETKKFYCVPDNYEIFDHSLDDIKMALDPEFSKDDLKKLDTDSFVYRVPSGDEYLPGIVGMNVIGNSDYVNVVVQALSHVNPIRDFFLIKDNYSYSKSPLVHAFGVVMRKLWSHNRFKCNVSPHEFLNEVTRSSNNKFTVKERKDASEFLRWLVNALIIGMKDSSHKITVMEECFKGRIEITSRKYTLSESRKRDRDEMENGVSSKPRRINTKEMNFTDYDVETSVKSSDYLMLTLDLPPVPLFKNSNNDSVVNQIPLYSLLTKYDGTTTTKEVWDNIEKSYRITKLPCFLILLFNRFKKNEFFYEKDTSIVQFPVRNLEVRDFYFPPIRSATRDIIMKMSETPLRAFITDNSELCDNDVNFDALRKHALEMVDRGNMVLPNISSTKYDLVANLCHDVDLKDDDKGKNKKKVNSNPVTMGSYRVHLKNNGDNAWYEVQELIVKETQPDLVSLSESSILIYERKN